METIKQKIAELLDQIEDEWILMQILRFIRNLMK